MVYEFIKLHHWHEEAEKRLWVQDHKGPDGEEFFGLYDDAKLVAHYVHLVDAVYGLYVHADELTAEGWMVE